MTDFTRIVGWLVDVSLSATAPADLFNGLIERLPPELALLRAHVAYTTLHPLHAGGGVTWTRGASIDAESYVHRTEPPANWIRSPLRHVIESRLETFRRRLAGPEARADFPILEEFAASGATDYLVTACEYDVFGARGVESGTGGTRLTGVLMSWTTDAPGGFSDAHVALLEALRKPFALAMKVAVQREIARNLAACYIGAQAGPRVLDGRIQRGDFDTTRAVVWFSDLRDSTELAATLPRADYIALLNEFFDCTAGAVVSEGGEPLTFIGDGALAIFPVARMGEAEARAAALRAAQRATAALRELSAGRPRALGFGIALHAGDLDYGNIGVPARQSWSVIGPVVNETARLEGLTKVLGEPIVASRAFAEGLDPAWRLMGAHALKGVPAPLEVFAPPNAR